MPWSLGAFGGIDLLASRIKTEILPIIFREISIFPLNRCIIKYHSRSVMLFEISINIISGFKIARTGAEPDTMTEEQHGHKYPGDPIPPSISECLLDSDNSSFLHHSIKQYHLIQNNNQ
jgi:hypothetical protein